MVKEYLDVKCEILKPDFIHNMSNVRNVAEMLETTQAMAIAYEILNPENKNLEFINNKAKLKKGLGSLFSKTKKEKKNRQKSPGKIASKLPGIEVVEDKIVAIATNSLIVIGSVLFTYVLFSNIYISSVNKTLKQLDKNKKQVDTATADVKNDINYIKFYLLWKG